MKTRIVSAIAVAALSALAGCSAETGDVASNNEALAQDGAAVCANPEGTNAGIAALVGAISLELHRWTVTTDFYIYRGFNNQEMLGLTSAGLAACGGSCPMTQNMLALQDSRNDLTAVFDGTKMSSWSFASRLVTGFRNQQTCKQGGWCPFPAHVFLWTPSGVYNGYTVTPSACQVGYRMNVNKPTAQNHANLTDTEKSQLANALIFTSGNGANPYIAYNPLPGTSQVEVDPPGGGLPSGSQTTGSDLCQKYNPGGSLNGQPCTCAAQNVYANGKLINNNVNQPNTYYCRCPAGANCAG